MATFGDLMRLARHLRGFTQKSAADKLGIAQAILSRLENDLIEPDVETRKQAVKAYNLPIEFFEISDTVYGPPVSVHTMLRGKKSEVSARDVDMITAELNIRLFHLRKFLESIDYSPVNNIPELDVEQYGSIEKIAATVRSHWKIPSGPIKNLTRTMERAGVIIGESNFRGAAISGVTFAAPGRPPLILINKNHPADRIRFTLAHELGHLVMHRFPTASMEDEANTFASMFLLPRTELIDTVRGRKITLELLASLKKEWRLSMQSILYAISSSGLLTNNQSRYLWQQISSRGWRMREPASLDFAPDPPSVLPTIIRSHIDDLGFEVEELVAMSRVGRSDFEEFYGDIDRRENPRPRLRII